MRRLRCRAVAGVVAGVVGTLALAAGARAQTAQAAPADATLATLLQRAGADIVDPQDAAAAQDAQAAQQPGLPALDDGMFDVSDFLLSASGFLPVVVPITEPAVGYGLGGGLAFFHDKLGVREGADGQPRFVLPSISIVGGAATENGTWGSFLGHLGVWDEGRVKYLGAGGYAAVNLDWYGEGDSLDGRKVGYENDVFFLYQRVTFQLGNGDFYLGPLYRFLSSNSSFDETSLDLGILPEQLQSRTAGLGAVLGFDTRDQPFSPRRGLLAEATYSQQADWLGGDFDYGKARFTAMGYHPLGEPFVLGVRFDAITVGTDAPFYDLASLSMRGIPALRFVDDASALIEGELRWDVAARWSLIGFGGLGRVADSFGEIDTADNQTTIGGGFRYLIASKFGLRLGLDVARGADQTAFYVTVGTGWLRP